MWGNCQDLAYNAGLFWIQNLGSEPLGCCVPEIESQVSKKQPTEEALE